MKPYRLSKSKIISGLQCRKRLYLEVHQPESRMNSRQTEALFAMGHRVGEIARSLMPGGRMIAIKNGDFGRAVRETERLLAGPSPPPLFEATFVHDHILVRADILVPENKGYRLVEVKASTGVKDYHLNDCAIQARVIEGAGHPLTKVELAHIDTGFVYPGEGHYDGLFFHADVTAAIGPFKSQVADWAAGFQAMLAGALPDIAVGPHCTDPFACPFMAVCWPEDTEFPVDILPRGGRVVEDLLARGIDDIRDIPKGDLEKPLHERIRIATINGEAVIDPELGRYLDGLSYPRFYLDFETVGSAVPVWPGTRPYQAHLAFQWSLHVEPRPGLIEHHDFLDLSGDDPQRALAQALIERLGNRGPVFVYSAFERSVLKHIASVHPDLQPELDGVIERLEDLLPLLRAHYYHPAMKGSWSIKAVLPTLAPGLNYADLTEIQDGSDAQAAYLEAITRDPASTRFVSLERHLRRYCEMDTLALVKLVHFFQGESSPAE